MLPQSSIIVAIIAALEHPDPVAAHFFGAQLSAVF